ncbi:DUF983 domain-containing protein [Amorphus sp. 3PC139-8]|uniref:DUF983 domain-containing protein n=1 Tax=Amorphus sp. 3PC139-8 TaxID=2735676 RepID=UPI00345DD4B2
MTSEPSRSAFGTLPEELPLRPVWPAVKRGALGKCPACGVGSMFEGYLTVRDHCPACGEALHHHRADDAPPYFTIVIVGHVIVSLVLSVEIALHPPLWVHALLWGPLTLIASLSLLRPIKGALVAYQWALYMHGFDPNAPPEGPIADPAVEAHR